VENVILIVVVILYGCVCGAFTQRVACEKGYSDKWLWAGFWFGLIALIAACGLPDRGTRAELLGQREAEAMKAFDRG
jgi:hypothetical protein